MKLSYFDYVKKYFLDNYSNYQKGLSDDNYGGIIVNVTAELEKKCSSIEKVKNGMMDEFINQQVCKCLNKLNPTFKTDYTNLYNAVWRYIENNYLYNSNKNTIKYFSKRISLRLIVDYNYLDLSKGLYDDKIKEEYNNICKDLEKRVASYIINNIDLLDGINHKEVASQFVNLIISNDKYDVNMYFDGSYNKLINDLCIRNKMVNSEKKVENAKNAIRKLIENRVTDKKNLNEIVDKIYNKLVERKYLYSDIINGNVNSYILNLCNEYSFAVFRPERINNVGFGDINRSRMKEQSVVNGNSLDKFKVRRGKEKVNKVVITLAVLGTLVASTYGVVHSSYNTYMSNQAISTVREWDGYSYSNIFTLHTDAFNTTAKNVVDTYDDYLRFENDNYKYLGFYRAYVSVKADRLYIMDNMLKVIKEDDSVNGRLLKGELRTTSCYLEFMYDRLVEMGYNDINEDDFNRLLNEYLQVRNDHRYEEPVQYLSKKHKKMVEKIRDKYIEYSEKYLVEFGMMLSDSETLSTEGKGR